MVMFILLLFLLLVDLFSYFMCN